MRGRLGSGKYQDKWFWIRRVTAMVVLIAMVATCVQSAIVKKNTDVVQAAAEGQKIISLSAIEELKETVKASDEQTFTIVEVVPALGTGSMAYWVPGEEPLTYYQSKSKSTISFIEEYDFAEQVGTSKRTDKAKKVIDDLKKLGLLSNGTNGTDTALTSADYAEYIPGIDTDVPVEAVFVELVDEAGKERIEKKTLNGIFTKEDNDTGAFDLKSSNVKLDNNGTYVQEVEKYLYGEEANEAIKDGAYAFYYKVTFEKIDFTDLGTVEGLDSGEYAGKGIYAKNADGERYDYLGTLGVDDYNIEVTENMEYYWVSEESKPNEKNNDVRYLGVGGFVPAEDGKGYFDADSSYVYVGENKGDYSFEAQPDGTATAVVEYSELYVNLGFTNNNWFRQHVLDDDTDEFISEFNIVVEEVLPQKLTEGMIEEADLLVVSSGFSLSYPEKAFEKDELMELYKEDNIDFSNAVKNYLKACIDKDDYKNMVTPIVVDGNLKEADKGSNIEDFAKKCIDLLKGVCDTGDVKVGDKDIADFGAAAGGLYVTPQDSLIIRQNIVEEIEAEDNDLIEDCEACYGDVSDTITYENFLRLTTGVEQITGTAAEVNIATAIRHILTVGEQISQAKKTEIRVLEIQPSNSNSTSSNATHDDKLDAEDVEDWFDVKEENITIDTIPTYEFIGKIDDITELYDVVYVGADIGLLNITEEKTWVSGSKNDGKSEHVKINNRWQWGYYETETYVDYNDDLMDGLYYTNIGDWYKTSDNDKQQYAITGLLNSDYETENGKHYFNTSKKFYALNWNLDNQYRLSGNDITPTKLEELNTFVETGLPVIISNKLVDEDDDEYSVRTDRVDAASLMYDFLDGNIGENNVFIVEELEDNKSSRELAEQYLNLTKPEINMTEAPTEYTANFTQSLVEDSTVSYTFTISNATDPTPEDTKYGVKLYIDQNADGKYAESELVSGLTIQDQDGNVISEGDLKVDVEYTVEKVLPDTYSGAIPWKIEVEITDRDIYHNSVTGCTYIKPSNMVDIKILQIYESKGQLLTANADYDKYFDEIRDANIYDIDIEGIQIPDLNANNYITYTYDYDKKSTYNKDKEVEKVHSRGDNTVTAQEIYEACFKDYDMLILGFGDVYGRYEYDAGLNAAAAGAVELFIESGRAVLFTHDTTCSANLPAENYPTAIEGNNGTKLYSSNTTYTMAYFAQYYFNTIIRDSVGLDRYGITDELYGSKYIYPYSEERNSLVANQYEDATEANIDALLEKDYSIAYQPDSDYEDGDEFKYVNETQGFTRGVIFSFTSDAILEDLLEPAKEMTIANAKMSTKTVSQVNKGQITTFPYNVNTNEFDSSKTDTTLDVSQTHYQYYQLNMNSDDIVVWYCLNDTTCFPNDVVNSYYIYNKGNVTYSGSGHGKLTEADTEIQVGSEEAKLFVNTMIAAYRAGRVDPDVTFADEEGVEITSMHFTSEEIELEDGSTQDMLLSSEEGIAESETLLPFMIKDANLENPESRTISMWYYDKGAQSGPNSEKHKISERDLKILDSDGVEVTATEKLLSNTPYTIVIPTEILELMKSTDINQFTIHLGVTSTFVDGEEMSGEASIDLYKLGLQDLI